MQSLWTLIPSVSWEPLKRSLPVVTVLRGGFQWISFKLGDVRGPLERSLPVVTVLRGGISMDFVQNWWWLGALRTIATGSGCSKKGFSMDFFQNCWCSGALRTLATGSDCSKGRGFQWISFKIGDDWGPLERSLPVVTVLRGISKFIINCCF